MLSWYKITYVFSLYQRKLKMMKIKLSAQNEQCKFLWNDKCRKNILIKNRMCQKRTFEHEKGSCLNYLKHLSIQEH